tara:strand:+ start:3089 stop:3298 length:210 start_codon:yes stop_codon:yes gene_type:complete
MKIKIELEITDTQLQNVDNVNTLMSFLANDLYTKEPDLYNYIHRLGANWADQQAKEYHDAHFYDCDCYR